MHPLFRKVTSSNIGGYFYMTDRQVLLVAFLNGRTYAYEGVDFLVVLHFERASSKGGFFNSHIKPHYAT